MEIQQLKQEVKDKEMRCKNAEKLLHRRLEVCSSGTGSVS